MAEGLRGKGRGRRGVSLFSICRKELVEKVGVCCLFRAVSGGQVAARSHSPTTSLT